MTIRRHPPHAHASASHRRRVAVRALEDPPEVERLQLWFGFIAGLSPFAIAAYEFGKRVLIQKRCARCAGAGLVVLGDDGRKVKCPACGGFLPWESWERFLTSEVGNGGVVRAPKGQTSAFYSVEKAVEASERMVRDDARERAREREDA